MSARFGHVNLIARDWQRLAEFYIAVFDCRPAGPQRDLSGEWLDRSTGLNGARIRGAHLRLPGPGADGPTLEIFTYDAIEDRLPPPANATGFGHIAFQVDDVDAYAQRVIDHGGSAVGDAVNAAIPGAGSIRFRYMRDPEGNIIELQKWSSA